jgi:type II secretory pathway pseudopilin PulG
MKLYINPLTQTGDTIVEVMIVLAILSLAISSSYATASRSLLNTRQADETSQATELVQSIINQLVALSPAGSTPDIYQSAPYCIYPSGTSEAIQTISTTPSYTVVPGTDYPQECQLDNLYNITISPTLHVSGMGGMFTVQAVWPDLTSTIQNQGSDTVTLSYEIDQ